MELESKGDFKVKVNINRALAHMSRSSLAISIAIWRSFSSRTQF